MNHVPLINTLMLFRDQRGRVYAPLQEVADELGWSRPKVQRGIAALLAGGRLIRHNRYLELLINFDQKADQKWSEAPDEADQNCSPTDQNWSPAKNDRPASLHVPLDQTVRQEDQTPPVVPRGDPPPPARRSPEQKRITVLPDDDLLPVEWVEDAKAARPDLAPHMQRVVQAFCDYHRDRQTRVIDLELLFRGWVKSERLSKYQERSTPDGRVPANRPVRAETSHDVRLRIATERFFKVMDRQQSSTA